MRRPARGGTTRPGPARPGSGFGRPVRSRPVSIGRDELPVEPAWWFERELDLARPDACAADATPGRAESETSFGEGSGMAAR